MAIGSIEGMFLGGLLLGLVPAEVLLLLIAVILLMSAARVWPPRHGRISMATFPHHSLLRGGRRSRHVRRGAWLRSRARCRRTSTGCRVGHYFLFAMVDDIPSIAAIVRVQG